jgi:hypothetical protein
MTFNRGEFSFGLIYLLGLIFLNSTASIPWRTHSRLAERIPENHLIGGEHGLTEPRL